MTTEVNPVPFHTLENGPNCYIRRVPNRVVTVDCWINTGSAREGDRDNGTAHFLEHMLFKGTPRFGPGELDRAIMGVGGVWNAGTSKDFTHYYATVAAPYWTTALDCIADMVDQPLIDQDEFDREKNVILEEWRRKQDNPHSVLYDELYDASYATGPYRRGVLGTFESISALDRDEMAAFHRRHYSTASMLLCVVGDVDEAEALDAVRQRVATMQAPVTGNHAQAETTVRRRSERREIRQEVGEAYLGMSFPAPAVGDLDSVLALDVAMTVLADGRSSRLVQSVREKQQLASSVSAGAPTHIHDSLAFVMATCEPGKVDAVEAACLEVLQDFAETGPTDSELAKARRILRNSHAFSTETNSGHTGMVGYSWTLTGDGVLASEYLDRVAAITADQSRDAVRSVLKSAENNSHNRVVLLPKEG